MPKHVEPSLREIPPAVGEPNYNMQLRDATDFLKPQNKYCHSRIEWWFAYLGITPLQQKVLGRIWSFQYSNDGRETKNYYAMSHASAAKSMGENPDNWEKAIKALAKKGIIKGTSNGPRRPVTYQVDLVSCAKLVKEKQAELQENRESNRKKGRERQEKWVSTNINSTDAEIKKRAEQQLRKDMRQEIE